MSGAIQVSETVIVVAIVVPALVMGTLGTVAIYFGHRFNMKAHAGPQGADFSAESKPEPASRGGQRARIQPRKKS